MSENERIVYDMIVRRYLAQFLGDHEYLKTVIEVECESERFRTAGKTPTVPGWRALYPQDLTKKKRAAPGEEGGEEVGELPPARQGEAAPNVRCEVVARKTQPPKRYTEGTLLAAMESIDREIEDPRLKTIMRNKEKAGIGTDATRSDIIENLFRREYIEARKKELHPTARGADLIALVEKVAPEVADPVLTAQWEDQLSRIEKGDLNLARFEGDLSAWLAGLLARIQAQAPERRASLGKHVTTAPGGAKVACPTCGKPMRRIEGSKGPFWGCTGYRDGCKTTLPDEEGTPGKPRESVPPAAEASPYRCPQCHKPMRRVPGPSGYFWGCSGYPQCKHTQPDVDGKPGVRTEDVSGRSQDHGGGHRQARTARAGDPCPECGKGVLVNKTLKDTGKAFVGCNHFPACRFFAWPQPKTNTSVSPSRH